MRISTGATIWMPPLLPISHGPPIRLGIRGDTWFIDLEPPVSAASLRGATALLPLLQGYGGAFSEVVEELHRRLEESALPSTLVATFPFQSIALAALESEEWAERLIGWLRDMPWFPDGRQKLRSHENDPRLSERLRDELVRVGRSPGLVLREPARVLFHLDGGFTKLTIGRPDGAGFAERGMSLDLRTASIPRHLRPIGTRLVWTHWPDGTEHIADFDAEDWGG